MFRALDTRVRDEANMSSYEKAYLGEPTRIDQGGRLSRGLSVLVIGALSILAWAVIVGIALGLLAIL